MARKQKIKGITIEINGDTVGLSNSLGQANDKIFAVQKELKAVNSALKFDPTNTVLLAQKQDLLAQSVQSTTDKLTKLEEAQSQVDKQFESGKINDTDYREFQREV